MRDLSTCNILVVDDEETNIDILVAALGDDYGISVAMDGEAALDHVQTELPDLVLLDIIMPGMDGYEVIQRLKGDNRTREIPVIFCTGMTETKDETKGLELGAIDYIRKPFSLPMVKARVRNHLQLKLALEDSVEQNKILRENAKLRDNVERIIRHDLKSPLTAMIGAPALLISDGNLSAKQVEMLQMLKKSGYRMLEIINSCQDMYKMETGRYQVREVPVDLLQLIGQIQSEYSHLIQGLGMKMNVRLNGITPIETDEFIVAGEELLCYSMLANLIKNAIEASPKNNEVNITLNNARGPLVAINNQGVVPEEVRDRFFDKYTTSGKFGGTGLGTYSAKLIATTLGCNIEFDTSEEKGTTIKIFLREYVSEEPDADKVSLPESHDAMAGPDKQIMLLPQPVGLTRHSKVLIADDYPSMRRIMISIMKQMGFTNFVEADDGASAKAILEHHRIGLVISDWNMPNMTGLDLLQYVRSRQDMKNTPFILVTGESMQINVIEAAKYQVSDYLIKPFTADMLRVKVEKYLT